MCGIFGLLGMAGNLSEGDGQGELKEKLDRRGPDGFGSYVDGRVRLFHSRLSIIDLEGGQQPVFNEDKSLCLVFNGEIFNFQELRGELERSGHRFYTRSDTEVIVHAYEEWGEECLQRFRGMFSFALWDCRKKKLFIARDRLGIKPLFYTVRNGTFYFASEMKAILQFDVATEISPEALSSYFALSYIPAPLTIFKDISKLPAGHCMTIAHGTVSIRKYWDVYFRPDHSKTEKTFISEFMALLEESVKLRMVSDVPVGAFLSGGVDSGMVVAMMSRAASEPVHTFCMGFGGDVGGYLDERGYARQVSELYKTKHREYVVMPKIVEILDDVVTSFDEPFADHSTIPSFYLCELTRKNVKVALSGLGGDELFGGYERYLGHKLSRTYNLLPAYLREKVISKIVSRLSERQDGHYTVNHMKRFVRNSSLPADERYYGYVTNGNSMSIFSDKAKHEEGLRYSQELVAGLYNSENAEDPLDRIFYTDMKTYLPEDILACTDRISMWHSLEVRVPFLDHKLLEYCATIPSSLKIKWWEKKHILKKASRSVLPKEIIYHRKQGFVGPLASWMRSDLRDYIGEALSREKLEKHGLFDCAAVKETVDKHMDLKENNEKLIWALIVFQAWYNKYLDSGCQ